MSAIPSDNAFLGQSNYKTIAEPTYAGALSFMRRRYSRDLTDVDVAVTGIPLDAATSGRPGARFGPRGIRAASANIAWSGPYDWAFDPFDVLSVIDYGDCVFDFGRPETIPEAIENHIREILDKGVATLTLGGDHFITYPVLKAYHRKLGPLALLHFDAHSDSWADEAGRVDHGTMFYHAAQEGLVIPERSVQVGLRTKNEDTLGFNILDARWVFRHGPEAAAEEIKGILGDHPVYVTFDIDCLDPAYAPGTGTPVFGGLTAPQVMVLLKELAGINVAGMDVVEVSPPYDHAEVTALAGATIATELLALFAAGRR